MIAVNQTVKYIRFKFVIKENKTIVMNVKVKKLIRDN